MRSEIAMACLLAAGLILMGCNSPGANTPAPAPSASSPAIPAGQPQIPEGHPSNPAASPTIPFVIPSSSPIAIDTNISIAGQQAIPAATSGQIYTAKVSPSGGIPPYNCSPAAGNTLPGTLVFSEPGCTLVGGAPALAAGTPTQSFPFSFIVKDSAGNVGGPFPLTLVVNQPVVKLNLPEQIGTAVTGRDFTYNFCEASSQIGVNCGRIRGAQSIMGTPPYSFTVSGQPLGLSMSLNGLLSGVVPEGSRTGDIRLTVCARDSVGSENCGTTILTVSDRQQPQNPGASEDCASFDGTWSGKVTATGTMEYQEGGSFKYRPYASEYDLELAIICDSEFVDESGVDTYDFEIKSVKASDPLFECAGGCAPVSGSSESRLSYLMLDSYGQIPKGMAIRFPNNMLIQLGKLRLTGDGRTIANDESPQAGLGSDPSLWMQGSIGWDASFQGGEGAKPKQVETANCGECVAPYPERITMSLSKTG